MSQAQAGDRAGKAAGARKGAGVPGLAAVDRLLSRLDATYAPCALMLALLPVLVVLLFPASFQENESQYLMLAYRHIAPQAFSPYSAAFDHTHARILPDTLMGSVVALFGYHTGQIVLRCLMMALYAGSLGFLLSGLGLSVLEAVLAVAIYGFVGPDLMGAEWLFRGVESKTFAYVFVFLGFGLLFRDRRGFAMIAALAVATYFHFLVGGFWFLALLALDALRTHEIVSGLKRLGIYVLAVLPLVAVIVDDQYIANAAPVPAHGMSADYLYALIRVPHHTAPFSELYRLGFWIHGVVATAGLLVALLLLARRDPPPVERALLYWLSGLLAYLVVVFGLSWFDRHTGILGVFFPFRPSALILLFVVVALVLAWRAIGNPAGKTSGRYSDGTNGDDTASALKRAAFVAVVPLFLWVAAKDHIKDLTVGFGAPDLKGALSFLAQHAGPDDIVLTDPDSDMTPLGASLPRLIRQPTLVSFKFSPVNPADLYRWWDLLTFRKAVFAGQCPKPGDPPVRFLFIVDPKTDAPPACGREVFRSRHFQIVELPPAG